MALEVTNYGGFMSITLSKVTKKRV